MIFKWWIQLQMFPNRREHLNRWTLFLLYLSRHIYLWCEIAIIYSVTIDKCDPFIETNGFLLDVPCFKSLFSCLKFGLQKILLGSSFPQFWWILSGHFMLRYTNKHIKYATKFAFIQSRQFQWNKSFRLYLMEFRAKQRDAVSIVGLQWSRIKVKFVWEKSN